MNMVVHGGRRFPTVVGLLLASVAVNPGPASAQYPSGPQIGKNGTAVLMKDYASLPLSSATTSSYPPSIDLKSQLSRVNFLRSEPANAPESSSRFFVNDLNRNLYILDKTARTFTPYIDFEEVFPKFDNHPGFAGGLVTFAFAPDYADNGTFYTVHTEDPAKPGTEVPTNTNLPGLDLGGGYTATTAVNPPVGTVVRQAVLVEWRDTDRHNSTFEGTAREILRVGFTTNIHPIGDLLFNPLAQPHDTDYKNLYIAVGDGGAGERADATHAIPQRLDALPGKILRITADITLRPEDELSANGRYRIPTTGADPNPFVTLTLGNLKKEIFAYGFRNPHRMTWDQVSNALIVTDIGLHSWEEVNVVAKGANYGYAEREGVEQLFIGGSSNGKTGSQTSPPVPFPVPDSLAVTGIDTPVTPAYPVANYSHTDGDAISSGIVYRGSRMPQLYGKYIFGDITTGRLFYSDLADLIAHDDGDRRSLAAIHELQVVFESPHGPPGQGAVRRRLFDIVADEYARKGGVAPGTRVLPGAGGSGDITTGNDPDGIPYGGGRADIRLAVGGDGEIYVLSKSDGMIRELVAVVTLPPDKPDLVEMSVTNPPVSALPGSRFAVTDTVRNVGGLAAGSSTTRYYFSADTVRDAGDQRLSGTRAVRGPLAPGATSTGTVTVTIPTTTPLGTYVVLVCADDLGSVSETDETNNCVASATVLAVTRPDLVETTVSDPPATVARRSSFAVTDTVTNQGGIAAGVSTVRYYLSRDSRRDGADRRLTGVRAVPGLAGGVTSTGTVTVVIPGSMPLDSYYLLACADDTTKVRESNESNNCVASAGQVTVTP